MPSEVIVINQNFACTLGLAAFVGVKGAQGDHAHWTHQIAIDMDGQSIACFCEGEWLRGQGVFVPSGHVHAVNPGRQVNLFFDVGSTWIAEIFGGSLDTSCARVLDRDTMLGIQSCFYEGCDLAAGMAIFANAFELRTQTRLDPLAFQEWKHVLDRVKAIKASDSVVDSDTYSKLGALFSL
jgi:hypothetical protein